MKSINLDCLLGHKSNDKYFYMMEEKTQRRQYEANIGVMWQ